MCARTNRPERDESDATRSAVIPLPGWLQFQAAAAVVFAGLLLLYSPSLRGGYLWDDSDNITKPRLRSWSGLEQIWFQWGATQTYYPILHTLYWVEWQVWDDSTLGYHVASIAFHSISVCLLYLIVRRLRIPGALLAAALFALHPVYVESVAWITEQKNTLSGMFYLGALLVYLRFDDDRRGKTYALALILFLLSLMSKTTAVTLPAALVVILWWKRGELSWRRDILPLAPWFGLSLLFGGFTVWYEKVYVGVQGAQFDLTLLQKCLLASRAVWFYLSKLFWPAELTFIYPRWQIDPRIAWQYLYLAGLLALFVAAWTLRRQWPGVLAAVLLFVGTLFPLLGFFPTYIFSYTYVCDHFQYLPSLAIVVLAAAGVAAWLLRLPVGARRVGQGACVAVLGLLAFLTWRQSEMFSDPIKLYLATIERNPECWMAHNNVSGLLTSEGRYSEAVDHSQRALALKPDYAEAHNELGLALAQLGQTRQAIEHYQQALQLKANFPAAHVNLGNALLAIGQQEQAVEQYREALGVDPNFPMAHFNLGNSLLGAGQLEQAIAEYQRAISLYLDTPEVRYNLGVALGMAGRPQEAIEQLERVVQAAPDFAGGKAQNNLGGALLNVGRATEAVEHLHQAMLINPDEGGAYLNLMRAYTELHRPTDAQTTAEHALEMARATGQTALAEDVEAWLKANSSQPKAGQDKVSPPNKTGPSR